MAGIYPDWMQPPPAMPQGDPFMDYMRAQQPDPYAMPTGSYADTPAPGMMGAPGESIQPGPPLVPMAPRPGVAPELDGPPPLPGQPAPPSWMPPGASGQRELGATPEWLRTGQGKGAPANDAAPAAKPSGMPWETPPTGTYQQRNRAITTAMQESKGREGQLEAQGQEAEAIARENAAKSRALADADDLKTYEAATAKAGRDRAQLDVEIKQLSEGKIDPQRFWNDAGTGAKIGMAVSAIIGGILAPNYGGRNTGVEMIEGIIKRDMAAQESDRENKRWALSQQRTSIGENLGDAGDLASRQAQARAAAYGVAIDQATAMRSRMTAPVAIERANQAIMGLEGGFVDSMANFEAAQSKAELDRISEERDYKLRSWQVAQGSARLKEEKRQFDAERADKAAERAAKAAGSSGADPKLVVTGADGRPLAGPDGVPIVARTEKEAQEARAFVPRMMNMRSNMKELIRLKESYGTENRALGGEGQQRIDSLTTDVMMDAKTMFELGVLAGPDLELLEKVVGKGATGVFSRDDAPRLRQSLGNFERRIDSRLRGYGYQGSYTQDVDNETDTFKPKDETAEKKRAPVGLPPPGKPVGYVAPPERVEPGSPADESIRRLRESRR